MVWLNTPGRNLAKKVMPNFAKSYLRDLCKAYEITFKRPRHLEIVRDINYCKTIFTCIFLFIGKIFI